MALPFFAAKWGLGWFTRIGTLALVLLLAWQCWDHFRPRKPELGLVRQGFADRIIPAMVNDLRQSQGSLQRAAVLHFANDPTDYFTNQFRAVLEHSGSFDLRDRTLGEKFADMTGLPQTTYGSLDTALPRGRSLGVQGVIFGKINSFESDGTTASIDMEVGLADVATGKVLFDKRYNKDTTPFTALAASLGGGFGLPWFGRLIGWILLVVLLPVFSIGFIRTMVGRQSNLSNAFVLAVYTAAGALLACLAGVSDFSSLWRIAFFVLLVGLAFAYNVAIMSFALRLET